MPSSDELAAASDAKSRLAAGDRMVRNGSAPHLFHFAGQDPTKMLPVHGNSRNQPVKMKPRASAEEAEQERAVNSKQQVPHR